MPGIIDGSTDVSWTKLPSSGQEQSKDGKVNKIHRQVFPLFLSTSGNFRRFLPREKVGTILLGRTRLQMGFTSHHRDWF